MAIVVSINPDSRDFAYLQVARKVAPSRVRVTCVLVGEGCITLISDAQAVIFRASSYAINS